MVGNQRPCITQGLRILEDFSQSLQEVILVGIASKYRPTFNASHHYMVQGTSSIDSRFPWHQPPIPPPSLLSKPKNLTAFPT
jgi:hypothetical protein